MNHHYNIAGTKPTPAKQVNPCHAALASTPVAEPERGFTRSDTNTMISLAAQRADNPNQAVTATVNQDVGSRPCQVWHEPLDDKRWDEQCGLAITVALYRANAAGRFCQLLMLRLSEYRVMEQTFGRTIGMELAALVAARLRKCLRASDIVEQVAADEFAIVIDRRENSRVVAGTIAERLVARCSSVYTLAGERLRVSAAVGIALYPADAANPTTLLRNARIALHQAELSGSSYDFFSPELLDRQRQQERLATELNEAIQHKRLVLHYQPQYAIESRRVVGVEALLRVATESGELIYPDQFISIAEDNGLILPIGHWVIREACQQLKRWRESGCGPLRMAVNLSASQLVDNRLVDVVTEAVEDAGVHYSDLELEITEQCLAEHLPLIENVLHQLRDKGIRLAVDDFGTGHSPLAYLARLPLSTIKIDRAFLDDIPYDSRASGIVAAIIAMAKGEGLQLEVVAAGVETLAQQQFIQAAGCDLGQGYGFARPQSADAIRPML